MRISMPGGWICGWGGLWGGIDLSVGSLRQAIFLPVMLLSRPSIPRGAFLCQSMRRSTSAARRTGSIATLGCKGTTRSARLQGSISGRASGGRENDGTATARFLNVRDLAHTYRATANSRHRSRFSTVRVRPQHQRFPAKEISCLLGSLIRNRKSQSGTGLRLHVVLPARGERFRTDGSAGSVVLRSLVSATTLTGSHRAITRFKLPVTVTKNVSEWTAGSSTTNDYGPKGNESWLCYDHMENCFGPSLP